MIELPQLLKHQQLFISQERFLQELKQVAGIDITAQTLRNWERHNLITPPDRKIHSDKRRAGRSAEYYRSALAEAYAVYKLTKEGLTLPQDQIPLPKFSLTHVAIARAVFYNSGFSIPNFPSLFDKSEKVNQILVKKVPAMEFDIDPIDGRIHQKEIPKVWENSEQYLRYMFYQQLYAAWYYSLREGCEKLLGNHQMMLLKE